MIFNSYLFWAFFAVVLLVYWLLPHKYQRWLLVITSYIFYGAWDWRFLSLIFISSAVDFVVGQAIDRRTDPVQRKRMLIISVLVNLGFLGIFKYFNFFAGEFVHLMDLFGFHLSALTINVVLPVGISFYTFQTMGYTIDVYYRRAAPSRDFLGFSLFVSFFPQLVAGPIERYSHLMPQFESRRPWTHNLFGEGLYHVLIGMFKKVVLADNLAPIADAIFATPYQELNGGQVLIGVWAFALQIYGDFSGYSSIAQGIARWMGFELMYNFKMPYFAQSPSDFWRRWHISLSQWLRDNLYVPLGGNRGSEPKTYRNLMLTMGIGGLWHGAAWTYVIWGVLHGALLCLFRPFSLRPGKTAGVMGPPEKRPLWLKLLLVFVMFQAVCLTWLYFRAPSATQAWGMLAAVVGGFSWDSFTTFGLASLAFYALPLLVYEAWVERSGNMLAILKVAWPIRAAFYSYMLLMLWFFPPEASSAFIYFQF
jgi:D-alanyl-lipoteichoic acid acyltransferase DltB (MBOAT superfamily)